MATQIFNKLLRTPVFTVRNNRNQKLFDKIVFNALIFIIIFICAKFRKLRKHQLEIIQFPFTHVQILINKININFLQLYMCLDTERKQADTTVRFKV